MCDEVRWVGGGGGGRDTRLRRWSESDGASWRCFYFKHNDNNYSFVFGRTLRDSDSQRYRSL